MNTAEKQELREKICEDDRKKIEHLPSDELHYLLKYLPINKGAER